VRPYETMIIFDVEVEEQAITGVLDRALELVRSNGGTTGAVERWGRRPFAYEMHHKREGYYVVAEYTAEPKASAELDRFLVLADEVLRHKIIRLPDKVAGRPRIRPPAPPRLPTTEGPRGGARNGARSGEDDAAPAPAPAPAAAAAPAPPAPEPADVAPAPAAD